MPSWGTNGLLRDATVQSVLLLVYILLLELTFYSLLFHVHRDNARLCTFTAGICIGRPGRRYAKDAAETEASGSFTGSTEAEEIIS